MSTSGSYHTVSNGLGPPRDPMGTKPGNERNGFLSFLSMSSPELLTISFISLKVWVLSSQFIHFYYFFHFFEGVALQFFQFFHFFEGVGPLNSFNSFISLKVWGPSIHSILSILSFLSFL